LVAAEFHDPCPHSRTRVTVPLYRRTCERREGGEEEVAVAKMLELEAEGYSPRASDRTASVGYVSVDRQQINRSPTKQIAQKGRGGQGN